MLFAHDHVDVMSFLNIALQECYMHGMHSVVCKECVSNCVWMWVWVWVFTLYVLLIGIAGTAKLMKR